jgi:hypothetical protein
MILSDNFGYRLWAKPVGKRTRCIIFKARRLEKVGHNLDFILIFRYGAVIRLRES